MSRSPCDFRRFDQLVSRFCDDCLTTAECAELEALLQEQGALRERHLQHLMVHGGLAWDCAGKLDPVQPRPAVTPRKPTRSHRIVHLTALLTAVAAVALVGLVLLRSFHGPSADHPQPPLGPEPAVVAQVAEVSGAVEILSPSGVSAPAAPGQELHAGQTVRTKSDDAFAVIAYADQTRLELSPETVIRLFPDQTGGKHVFFSAGALRADAAPQPADRPFVITSPQAKIRVQGTRFLVASAGPEATRVELEAGRLELIRLADGRAVELDAGSYAVVRADLDALPVRALPSPLTQPLRQLTDNFHAGVVSLRADGSVLAANNRTIRLWDAAGASRAFRGIRNNAARWEPVCSADGALLSLLDNRGRIVLWDVAQRRVRRTIATNGSEVRNRVLAPDGTWLATAALTPSHGPDQPREWVIRLWEIATGEERVGLTWTAVDAPCLAASPDGRLLAGAASRQVRLWDTATGRVLGSISVPMKHIGGVAFSPDVQWLAVGESNRLVQIWDVATRSLRCTIQGSKYPTGVLAFAPRSTLLALGTTSDEVWLWDAAIGEERLVIRTGQRPVSALAFAADGRTLVTGGNQGPVQLWDISPIQKMRHEPQGGPR